MWARLRVVLSRSSIPSMGFERDLEKSFRVNPTFPFFVWLVISKSWLCWSVFFFSMFQSWTCEHDDAFLATELWSRGIKRNSCDYHNYDAMLDNKMQKRKERCSVKQWWTNVCICPTSMCDVNQFCYFSHSTTFYS